MYNYCFKVTRYGAPLLKAYMCSITISIVERRGFAHKWEDGEQPWHACRSSAWKYFLDSFSFPSQVTESPAVIYFNFSPEQPLFYLCIISKVGGKGRPSISVDKLVKIWGYLVKDLNIGQNEECLEVKTYYLRPRNKPQEANILLVFTWM